MPTHQLQLQKEETYFVTFTCHKWLPLFDQTGLYNYFQKWFEYLGENQVLLLGYVIMPNHTHLLIHQRSKSTKTLNTLVGNGKRFLAYEIVNRLHANNEMTTLDILQKDVSENERSKGKNHQFFRPSFDAKICYNLKMLETKLHYIHLNPVSGKWQLTEDWLLYKYSSAVFYEKGEENKFLTHYKDVW